MFFVEGKGADGQPEHIFYIQYRRGGKLIEEKAGRQRQDDMTPARANAKRLARIEGRESSNQEKREETQQEQWTFAKLREEHKHVHPLKGLAQDVPLQDLSSEYCGQQRTKRFCAPRSG